MAVDQSHIDDIIQAASSDDPAVRFQNLEREVDLLKITIKRLLMDIRERMNELDNPFTLVSSGSPKSGFEKTDSQEIAARESALEAREAALEARQSALEMDNAVTEEPQADESLIVKQKPVITDTNSAFPIGSSEILHKQRIESPLLEPEIEENLPLQKTYHLFCWTESCVKKIGHDQFGILVESYHVLGYIQRKHAGAIKQIAELMPVAPEESLEIGPYQFIEELYMLNRILSPEDTSLDRDMIEVMLEQRKQESGVSAKPTGISIDMPEQIRKKAGSGIADIRDRDFHWMNLQA